MSTVISIENVSKYYRLGAIGGRTLKGDLDRWWAQLRGRPDPLLKVGELDSTNHENGYIWALREATVQIPQGETLGVIGRNGAGKSTLLKILSRVTSPTSGIVRVNGRIASLLEVGTGFHPDLTGRENTYLNGAILGMSRKEVRAKLDEIIAFAEIEKFIDTPVKRYSSGMYVRLAFAVAAHLEPEILVVDEVLAVGDAAFQKKCLGKMKDVSHLGRTVLFVSHNIGAITSLCNRCLWLDNGRVVRDGATSEVAGAYQSRFYSTASDPSDLSSVERYGTGKARFTTLKISPVDSHGEAQPVFITGNDLKVELSIEAKEAVAEANVALIFHDAMGFRLIDVNTALQGYYLSLKSGQRAQIEFQLHDVFLKPGQYFLGLWLGRHNFEDIDGIASVTSFTIEPNVGGLKHSLNFPGAYQCQFSQKVKII